MTPISTPTQSATSNSPLPPRYSSLTGTLSPEASQMLRSLSTTSGQPVNGAYPPRYSNAFNQHGVTSGMGRGSSVSRSAGLQPFEYHIKSGNVNKTQPWATLKVFSRSSSSLGSNSSSVKLPKFTSKDPVQGCLELNLESPQNINSISLSLRGKIARQFEDGCYFLDHPVINWTRTNGDPRAPPDLISSRLPTVKKFDGKLSGSYVWPFFFQFPSEVIVVQDGEQQKYPTPQTFVERGTDVTIQYSLVLKMTHGMLRTDSKLHAGIVYVPDIIPPAFSILRQVAYLHATKIPGPEADPLGWNTLPPAVVFGKLADRPVKLECSLSIANPLTYTRGTFIPVHLTIRSSNTKALKALANPRKITVRLARRLQYYRNTTQLGDLEEATAETVPLEQAVWQETDASIEEQEHMYVKHLEGEIHLRKDLQPSCSFCWFKVSYIVELLPFNNDSILKAPTSGSSEILLSHSVAIATQRSVGLAPIPSTTRPNLRGESNRPRPRTTTTIRANHQTVPYFVSYYLTVPAV